MASYCGTPPLPPDLMDRWNLDPIVLLMLAVGALLARRAARPPLAWAGMAGLFVAFVSPLCALSVALFSARSVHHLLIVVVAAPLLAFALRVSSRSSVGITLAISTVTLWMWHVPAAYDAALADSLVYWVMQLSLLTTSVAFWRALLAAPAPVALIGAIGGMTQMGMLGGILTFARAPVYASHLSTTDAWGIAPLADQQLGGLIMWVAGMLPYAAASAWLGRVAWKRLAAA